MNRDRILEWGRIWRLKHKDQIRDKDKKYRSKNKEKLKKYHREYDSKRGKELIQRRTTAALVWYSNGKPECAKCGEANIRNLEIDHINNRGALHRKKIGNRIIGTWLINNGFPDGFQVLCGFCNKRKYAEFRRDKKLGLDNR